MSIEKKTSTTHTAAAIAVPSGLAVLAFALTTVSVGLLVAGSAVDNVAMLAWGCVAGMAAVGLGCLAALRGMIEAAVARSVDRTAVRVGQAIAEALASDVDDRASGGAVRLYS